MSQSRTAITVESATVYRAGGRRYFTLRAAAVALARQKVSHNCDCDYIDHEGYGRQDLPCRYHNGSAHAEEVLRRLANLYMRAYRAARRPNQPLKD